MSEIFFKTAAIRHLTAYRQGIWRAPYQMTASEIYHLHRDVMKVESVERFAADFRVVYNQLCTDLNFKIAMEAP